MDSKVQERLSELVQAVREESEGVAGVLEGACARLDELAGIVAPLDRRLAEALRQASASLEQHTPALRKAASDFESKMLPNEPEPDVIPMERAG